MPYHQLKRTLLLGLVTASGWSPAQSPPSRPLGEYWADCAAAMTQRALIREELERQDAKSMYGAIGHYYKLSCAYSSPVAADVAYSKAREAQMAAFQAALGTCKTDPDCLPKFVSSLDGELLTCAGEQRKRSEDIAKATRVVNEACNIEVKP